MSISTYEELKSAVQNWGKRSDILTVVDDFIDLAESDMWQNLRIRDMETRDTGNLSGRTLALPADYVGIRKFRLTTATPKNLTFRTPESMNILAGSKTPTEYTITDQMEFNVTPDSTYSYEMAYFKSLTALSSSNASNAVLSRFPTVYLYGALFHFAQWAQNDALLVKYSALFDEAMDRANRVDRKARYGAAKSMKIEGSTP